MVAGLARRSRRSVVPKTRNELEQKRGDHTKENEAVGGEQSGHIVLSDVTTTGDGLVSALQILAVAVASERPVSEVFSCFEPLPQLLRNVRYDDGRPLDDNGVQKAIDAAKQKLGNNGRLVIRPSGTEPVIRVMAEGDDRGLVEVVVGDICEAVRVATARAA